MLRRLIPQPVARIVCATFRHRLKRYTAWSKGVQVVVYTCRCGERQTTKVLPANRKMRRAADKARR